MASGTHRGQRSVEPIHAELRVWDGDAGEVDAIGRAESALRLRPDGLFAGCDGRAASCGRTDGAGCMRFQLDPRTVYADGTRVAPEHLIEAWEAGLRDSTRAHGWLLAPVLGGTAVHRGAVDRVAGLRSEGDAVVVCFGVPTPDFVSRLDHPDLWLRRARRDERAGPFVWDSGRALLSRPHDDPPRSGELSVMRFVDPRDEPAELFRRGELDLAVVYGHRVGSCVKARETGLRAERAPGRDKSYALWFDPERRWVADPTFRSWLGAVVDADSMLRLVFDGRGVVAGGLVSNGFPRNGAPETRPFGPGSAPRLELAHDARDPEASRIAARIKAVVEQQGVAVRLVPRDGAEGADAGVILLVHRPLLDDSLLALQESLWRVRESAGRALERLARASRLQGRDARERAAIEIERELLSDGRLLPLVRLEGWIVADERLRTDPADRWGRLDPRALRWSH